MSRDNRGDSTPYAVLCDRCGLVFLTDDEYSRQLEFDDALWTCPNCGGVAEWDDDCQETNPHNSSFDPSEVEEDVPF